MASREMSPLSSTRPQAPTDPEQQVNSQVSDIPLSTASSASPPSSRISHAETCTVNPVLYGYSVGWTPLILEFSQPFRYFKFDIMATTPPLLGRHLPFTHKYQSDCRCPQRTGFTVIHKRSVLTLNVMF